MGFIYLLIQVDPNGQELYKIGISKNDPKLRLRQLQTGNPNKISLLNYYQSINYLKIERLLHKKYNVKTNAKNEWRTLTNDDVFSFINDCKKLDETIKFLIKENHFYK